jgi:hypothetical protein
MVALTVRLIVRAIPLVTSGPKSAECPLANNSPSFQEGCIAYTDDNARPDPNADDNGDMIGARPEKSDDDDDDK